MRFLVTRPQPECRRTADRLRALGHIADELPLLELVDALPERFDLTDVSAIAITSARVPDLLRRHSQFDALSELPTYTVGDRTLAAAQKAGFSSVRSADGDADALAGLVIGALEPGRTVLYPAARDRSGNLEKRFENAGLACRLVEVYRMEALQNLPAPIETALAAGIYDCVLVYSRRTGEAFSKLLAAIDHPELMKSLRICAISAQAAGAFGEDACVFVADKPREEDLLALALTAP